MSSLSGAMNAALSGLDVSQQAINVIRGVQGGGPQANNVIFMNASGYTNPNNFSDNWEYLTENWESIGCIDPLVAQGYPAQLAFSWHAYSGNVSTAPTGGTGGGIWANWITMQNALGIPGIITELGDTTTSGGSSGWLASVISWMETNSQAALFWSANPGYLMNGSGQATALGNQVLSYLT